MPEIILLKVCNYPGFILNIREPRGSIRNEGGGNLGVFSVMPEEEFFYLLFYPIDYLRKRHQRKPVYIPV